MPPHTGGIRTQGGRPGRLRNPAVRLSSNACALDPTQVVGQQHE
jgi:hypothetical protein